MVQSATASLVSGSLARGSLGGRSLADRSLTGADSDSSGFSTSGLSASSSEAFNSSSAGFNSSSSAFGSHTAGKSYFAGDVAGDVEAEHYQILDTLNSLSLEDFLDEDSNSGTITSSEVLNSSAEDFTSAIGSELDNKLNSPSITQENEISAWEQHQTLVNHTPELTEKRIIQENLQAAEGFGFVRDSRVLDEANQRLQQKLQQGVINSSDEVSSVDELQEGTGTESLVNLALSNILDAEFADLLEDSSSSSLSSTSSTSTTSSATASQTTAVNSTSTSTSASASTSTSTSTLNLEDIFTDEMAERVSKELLQQIPPELYQQLLQLASRAKDSLSHLVANEAEHNVYTEAEDAYTAEFWINSEVLSRLTPEVWEFAVGGQEFFAGYEPRVNLLLASEFLSLSPSKIFALKQDGWGHETGEVIKLLTSSKQHTLIQWHNEVFLIPNKSLVERLGIVIGNHLDQLTSSDNESLDVNSGNSEARTKILRTNLEFLYRYLLTSPSKFASAKNFNQLVAVLEMLGLFAHGKFLYPYLQDQMFQVV